MLDEMSERDPGAYAEFIEQQAKNAGADGARAREVARRAAEAPEFSVQRSTDEALFGSATRSRGGVMPGKSSPRGEKDDELMRQLMASIGRPSGGGAPGDDSGAGLNRNVSGTGSGGLADAMPNMRNGPTQASQRRDEKPKSLITEVNDGKMDSTMRLPKYTMTQEVASETTSSDSGNASIFPSYRIEVTTPELASRSTTVDVSVIDTGIVVSIDGCTDLFIPLLRAQGHVESGSEGGQWEAKAKRSVKKASLTVTVAASTSVN